MWGQSIGAATIVTKNEECITIIGPFVYEERSYFAAREQVERPANSAEAAKCRAGKIEHKPRINLELYEVY